MVPLPPSVPPDATLSVLLALPKVPFTTNAPLVTLVAPPNALLLLVRVVAPVPIWLIAPLPEITPGVVIVVPEAGSKASVALSVILPAIDPLVVPLPSCSVPAEIVVAPV
jgi:hypothetical protein